MNNFILPLFAICLSSASLYAADKGKPRTQEETDAATRLQVFLDRANFSPGKLDGYYGDFTRKALALYRQSKGEAPAAPAPESKKADKEEAAPDVSVLDLASIDPIYIEYTVTEADVKSVGELPASVKEQAKLKWLPYHSVDEAIGEKFHCDVDFLAQLNPGKTKNIKAGDSLKVPNVEAFDIGAVKDIKPGGEIAALAANEVEEEPEENAKDKGKSKDKAKEEKKKEQEEAAAAVASVVVNVDTKTNMLEVREADKLVAAYPVTIGSEQTKSPIGDWKIKGVARLPDFRYDEKLLKEGTRSKDSHLLHPGPNNPVGVIWIALNKKGNGLHGTSDPDAIGRSASHGCVRLANWDVARLASKVKAGVSVSIH